MNQDVAIKLESEVIYVEGYVNDKIANFYKVTSNIWTANVPKSEVNTYKIQIKAYRC